MTAHSFWGTWHNKVIKAFLKKVIYIYDNLPSYSPRKMREYMNKLSLNTFPEMVGLFP